MSEYQYYEFHAIERPLSERERRELRACSTRATIASTLLINHYEWGDLKGDPRVWIEKYLDAFLTSRRTSRPDRFTRDPSLRGCPPPDTNSDRAERPTTTCSGLERGAALGRWRGLAVFSRRLLRRLPWPKQPALRTCFCRTATRRAARPSTSAQPWTTLYALSQALRDGAASAGS